MPDQKTIWTRCLGGSFVIWVPKPLFINLKIRFFWPQTSLIWPKTQHFWPKIGIFGPFGHMADQKTLAFLVYLIPCPSKKQCEQGASVVFPSHRYQNQPNLAEDFFCLPNAWIWLKTKTSTWTPILRHCACGGGDGSRSVVLLYFQKYVFCLFLAALYSIPTFIVQLPLFGWRVFVHLATTVY